MFDRDEARKVAACVPFLDGRGDGVERTQQTILDCLEHIHALETELEQFRERLAAVLMAADGNGESGPLSSHLLNCPTIRRVRQLRAEFDALTIQRKESIC